MVLHTFLRFIKFFPYISMVYYNLIVFFCWFLPNPWRLYSVRLLFKAFHPGFLDGLSMRSLSTPKAKGKTNEKKSKKRTKSKKNETTKKNTRNHPHWRQTNLTAALARRIVGAPSQAQDQLGHAYWPRPRLNRSKWKIRRSQTCFLVFRERRVATPAVVFLVWSLWFLLLCLFCLVHFLNMFQWFCVLAHLRVGEPRWHFFIEDPLTKGLTSLGFFCWVVITIGLLMPFGNSF